MREMSLVSQTDKADNLIRVRFKEALSKFNRETAYSQDSPVAFENKVDNSSPSLNYVFYDEYTFLREEDKPNLEFQSGCDKCRPNMAHEIGCEYTRKCGCLEDAAVDEARMNETETQKYQEEKRKKKRNPEYIMDTSDLPKRFPYSKGLLIPFYLDARHVIHECNAKCACGENCKTRVTEHRRKVSVQIFKTTNRGWGLRCTKPLKKGQFVDFYYGELIPVEEADRRLGNASKEKASYIFALDKYHDYVDGIEEKVHTYDVDGEFIGGPVRFMNHSCEPNCRQHVVSFNKNDRERYNLALFALEDIPAMTELTFDYVDPEDEDDEDDSEVVTDSVLCLCGAENCRKWLWR
jgi:[histone H3]-lysine9 N-trimethyltransferase SUV39H